ncbi:hypothetical protein PSP6_510051 [Paraburkholderia tropica]|nr:hypothetical protein PSP6_510051 [Paraburkholderia tropica]
MLEYSVVLDQCHDGNDPTNDEYWSSADISILQGGVVMTSVHYEANDYKRRSNDSHILISMIRSVISADRHEVAAF